jgi:hypothetical protein
MENEKQIYNEDDITTYREKDEAGDKLKDKLQRMQ